MDEAGRCCPTLRRLGGRRENKAGRVQPLFAPEDEVYLALKANRCLRVVHKPGEPFYTESVDDFIDSDDEESYWFEAAAPHRPKIRPSASKGEKKRIFHKFEAQPERKIPSIPSASTSGSRLVRKTIKLSTKEEDEDEDAEDVVSLELNGRPDPELHQDATRVVGPALETQSGLILNITADSTKFQTSRAVESVPDPEEAQADEDVTVTDSGNRGGMANVGFEPEEVSVDQVSLEMVDAGYGRIRDPEGLMRDVELPRVRPKQDKSIQKPLLFFIHGIGGSADSWSDQLGHFRKLKFECVALDLLGHGFSSAPDKESSYKFQKLLGDVVTVFDHFVSVSVESHSLGVPRECVIVGHSYGCAMGTALSRLRPDNVKLLILGACGGPTPLVPPEDPETSCCFPFARRFGKAKQTSTAAASVAARRMRSDFYRDALHIPPYILRHLIKGQSWPEGDAAYFRRVTIPTLLVYGLKDSFVSLVEMCEMERTMPKSFLELVPLAGHSVMQDQPQTFNAMMKRFIVKYTLRS